MTKHRKTAETLNDFEERFCQRYIEDLNATQSMFDSGFEGKSTSAATEGSKLLRKPNVVSRIRTLMEDRAKRSEVHADQVLLELKRLGYSDLRGLYNENGTIKHPSEWSDDLARAVSSIEVEETFERDGKEMVWTGYTKKVKFWPKDKALELMGKHKKLFTDKVELSGKLSLADLVAGSKEEEKNK